MSRRAVFLDKDGTLTVDVPYNVDPARLRLMPGAIEGLSKLREAGYELIVVSNQSGVARGYFDEAALDRLFDHLRQSVEAEGIPLLAVYHCPHHVDGSIAAYSFACDCRKPGAGLLRRAAGEQGIDLRSSFMVGDILDDIEAGKSAGCRTVLIDNGGETEWLLSPARTPDYTAPDITAAAEIIVSFTPRPVMPVARGGHSHGG